MTVFGPLICDQTPVPIDGAFPIKEVVFIVQAKFCPEPAFEAVGDCDTSTSISS